MPRVTFTKDFDWCPTPSTAIAYKAGMTEMVTTECAEAAVEAGRGHVGKADEAGKGHTGRAGQTHTTAKA